MPIKNRPPGETDQPAEAIVSPDALALVRFGLRAADDPRIVDTVKVIDAQLRCDLPQGPVWYRYTGDGYGEHADGAPFDGTGQGRPWPLLAGERAHYELAAGRKDRAASLLRTFEAIRRTGRPAAGTGLGRPRHAGARIAAAAGPSGSAMPLVWAHSEHIKLLRSLRDGAVFDMPPQGVKRYIEDKTVSPLRTWRFNNKIRTMPAGKTLRVELQAPGGRPLEQRQLDRPSMTIETTENAFGVHLVDLPVTGIAPGKYARLHFFLARREPLGECRLFRRHRRAGQPVDSSISSSDQDETMQIGMMGLGRMGANMVRRLMRDGHECVVYDINPASVAALVKDGAIGAASLEEFVGKLTKPRSAWLMLPAAITGKIVDQVAALMEPGDIIIDGGNSYYHDAVDQAAELAPKGLNYVDVGTSGGVWGLERGYCLMIGGPDSAGPASRSDLRHPGARRRCRRARPRQGRGNSPVRLSALRTERRRPFRQDGPQRHRIRRHGRLCRRHEHPEIGQCRQAAAYRRRRDQPAGKPAILPVRHRPGRRWPKSGGMAASSAPGCST